LSNAFLAFFSLFLKASKLTKGLGSLLAVNSVDLEIEEAKVYSIIGTNGARKILCLIS
jgi:ABC-type branched-subunit amino acid transport system ATPase component